MLGYTLSPVEMSPHGTRCLKMLFLVNLEPHSRDLLIELIFLSFCVVNSFLGMLRGWGEASESFLICLSLNIHSFVAFFSFPNELFLFPTARY